MANLGNQTNRLGVSRRPPARSLESSSSTWIYCSHAVSFQTGQDFYKPLVKPQLDVPIHPVPWVSLPRLLCLLRSASLFSWKVEAKHHFKSRGLDGKAPSSFDYKQLQNISLCCTFLLTA